MNLFAPVLLWTEGSFRSNDPNLVRLFQGIITDVKARSLFYTSDYTDGMHRKVVSASFYLFFACLANAIAFGALSSVLTGGQIGIIEMIIATAIGGVCYALFSAQPITLLGGTGPIVIFTALLYLACKDLGLNFIAVYAWTGIWAGLTLILLSVINASRLMRYFSRFTDDIFAALVSIIFVIEAFRNIVSGFSNADVPLAYTLFGITLAFGTVFIALMLRSLVKLGSRPLPGTRLLADFAPTLAIIMMTLMAITMADVPVEGPAVPNSYEMTSTGRLWLVQFWTFPLLGIFACMVPGLFAATLLFLDQNITSRIINESNAPLRKGKGYHLDLLLIGLLTLGFSFFGLPWIVAATVHSVNHLKSLEIEAQDRSQPAVAVVETRISALFIHVAIAGSLLLLPYVKLIPMPVLFGLFIYMGMVSLWGNAFFIRALSLLIPSLINYGPDGDIQASRKSRNRFTLVQGSCLVLLWAVKSSVLGILFPVFIALCVPVRILAARYFRDDDLKLLDDYEQPSKESD